MIRFFLHLLGVACSHTSTYIERRPPVTGKLFLRCADCDRMAPYGWQDDAKAKRLSDRLAQSRAALHVVPKRGKVIEMRRPS